MTPRYAVWQNAQQAFVSARRAPSKETLAGFFGWLLAGLAWLLAGFLAGLAPGWLSGWFGLAPGWFWLVWLLAGFLGFGLAPNWLSGWFGLALAGLAWLSFFPLFFAATRLHAAF